MSAGWQLCFDSDTHKAPLNIILVLLLWAALTGATPLLNAPFDKTTDGAGAVWGLWSTSALIHPTIKTLWKTNICLAKVKALEPGAHLSVCPGFHPFIPAWGILFFFVRASTLPHSFGQDIKRDQGGSESQPFPTRRVTTASCLDGDNSGWMGRRSGKEKHSRKEKRWFQPDYHSCSSVGGGGGEHF